MKQDLKNDPNIQLGNVELPEGFDDLKNEKLRITAWIDGDVYQELQKRAKAGEANGKYQTLMNELLREILFERPDQEEAIATVVRKLLKIEEAKQRALVRKEARLSVEAIFKKTPSLFKASRPVQRGATKKKMSHG